MHRALKSLGIACVVVIALALCPCAVVPVLSADGASSMQSDIFAFTSAQSAFAADENEDSDQGDEEGQEDEETPIEKAKRLIAALPADPDDVGEEHRAALDEAQAAYDALSSAERAELDDIYLGKEQTYGRWLEAAQWGLLAKQPIDSTLDVVDGDYSAYVSSSSSMGKSTSTRSKTWAVTSLTVDDGQVHAVVQCDSVSAFRRMRVGGVDYTATVVDGVPEFAVPLAVNDTTTITVDANDIADSIAVQITVTLPLNQASADEVSAAKSAAQRVLSGLDKYTTESATALKDAANALMDAASKSGVATVELNVATTVLNSALENAQEKPASDDSSSSSAKKSSSSSSKKSKSSSSKSSSSSAKSSTAAARTTPTTANRAPSAVTSTSKSSSSSSSKSSAAAAAATSDEDDDGQSQSGVVELVPESALDEGSVENAVILMGVLALILVGMCARTFLFVRAKEVA